MSNKCIEMLYRVIEGLYDWSNVYFIARRPHVLGNILPAPNKAVLDLYSALLEQG